ncbi:MAG: response regulator, partial [Desulfobacteraceae bacterium]|nr:response regulator [Desulfobacteraceae bacterium]
NITDEQLIGKYNVFEDEVAIEQGLIPKIRTVFEHGKTANISVEWDAKKLGYKDANKVYIEGTMFPIYNDKGDLTNVVNHWIDTTKRKQAEKAKTQLEAQLHQSQKMESIGTLAGGIAHDFNNILFPIVGHSEMLMEDIPEDSPFQENLQEIYTASLRAKGLVKQILTFSRQKRIDLKLIKIQPIIKEALKLIRSTIPTTINIKQYIKKDCGIIKADPIQIHQVVMNLATNAYQAMEKTGGDLIIRLEEVKLSKSDIVTSDIMPGIYNFLIVSDTGKGMDKKLVEKIFDPFFTTKGKSKGTGMGLSVVHGIIKSMNGFITVYSKPDKGTEFHIYLPVVKNPSKTQKVHQMKHPIHGGIERILLVDDENSVVIIVKQMLERLGYQVTSRTSSTEALEAFRAEPDKFDLVISDFAMPNMPGDKLASKLTKIRPNIPILLCTGFSETLTEEKAVSMGINGFLMKPVVMKDLNEKIRDILN